MTNSFRPPKSRAGVRVVAFPELIVPDVRKHRGSVVLVAEDQLGHGRRSDDGEQRHQDR